MWITFISGVGHVGGSVVIGLVGIALGISLNKLTFIESFRGDIVALLLICFGLIYSIYGFYKFLKNGGHHHLPDFLIPKRIRLIKHQVNHGLTKKTVFIGMSKGGVNEFNWSVVNPDKVACIYADNPCLFDEDFAKIPELAKHDIPLLHVVGTEDWILRYTMTVEQIYHQWGGSITVITKEGVAHHPHSLEDPTLIADWIEQHLHPVEANRPAFVDSNYTKTHFYSLENFFMYLKKEDTYATVRGPGYVPSYDRYSLKGASSPPTYFRADDMSIVVPQQPAPGNPWVFYAYRWSATPSDQAQQSDCKQGHKGRCFVARDSFYRVFVQK